MPKMSQISEIIPRYILSHLRLQNKSTDILGIFKDTFVVNIDKLPEAVENAAWKYQRFDNKVETSHREILFLVG